MNTGVVAVVVTYNSDDARLMELLLTLAPQCSTVVIDNSTNESSRHLIRDVCERVGVFLISLGENFGVAYAQNQGIAWARERAASDILLMDDDSMPSQSLVMDILKARQASLVQAVVISARIISKDGTDMSNRAIDGDTALTPCSELNSSGTLIPVAVFDRVGVFDDRLFIDCVDFEWGWRALEHDVPLLLSNQVAIQHRLGEGRLVGMKIPNPLRHYYQYRNVLRMIVSSRAPLNWRLWQLIKLPVKLIMIVLFFNARADRLRYAAWGIVDFLAGRFGKFNH